MQSGQFWHRVFSRPRLFRQGWGWTYIALEWESPWASVSCWENAFSLCFKSLKKSMIVKCFFFPACFSTALYQLCSSLLSKKAGHQGLLQGQFLVQFCTHYYRQKNPSCKISHTGQRCRVDYFRKIKNKEIWNLWGNQLNTMLHTVTFALGTRWNCSERGHVQIHSHLTWFKLSLTPVHTKRTNYHASVPDQVKWSLFV